MVTKIKLLFFRTISRVSYFALKWQFTAVVYQKLFRFFKTVLGFEYFLKLHRIEPISQFLKPELGDRIVTETSTCYRNIYVPAQWVNSTELTNPSVRKVMAPYAYLAELHNCAIVGVNNIVIRNNSLLLDNFFFENAKRDNFVNHFRIFKTVANRVLVEYYSTDIKINECICIAGAGSFNYYHFVLEHLSKFYFLENIGKHIPIVIDEVSSKIPQFMELLKCFTDRDIIILKAKTQYNIDRLYYATPLLWMTYYPHKGLSYRPEDCIVAEESINFIRNKVLDNFFAGKLTQQILPNVPPLIYISKLSKGWRNFNEEAVLNALKPLGFVVVFPEKLTLAEQIHLFQNAKFVVGAGGAWLTNALFAKKGINILIFSAFKDISSFNNFTDLIGIRLDHFLVTPEDSKDLQSNFVVDVESLTKVVKYYLDQYTTTN